MSENNNLESGFKINNIILLESIFKREIMVTFNNPDTQKNLSIDVDLNINENVVSVTLNLNYTQVHNEVTEFSSNIKMVGIFEKFGNNDLDLDQFGRVNGAAILFPYLREHLTGLSAKAGLGLLILPPFNFTNNKK
jgi:preprotein translocase subunit SecB